jgi:predicted transcriptional regulator
MAGMERIILQGTPREVLDRLRELLNRPGAKDETVQVTVETASDTPYSREDGIAEGLRRGLAEADRGEFVEHERVLNWLDSLGTDHELPMPKLP